VGGQPSAPRFTAAPLPSAPASSAADKGPLDLEGIDWLLLSERKVLRELKCTARQRDQIADEIEKCEEELTEDMGATFKKLIRQLNNPNPQDLKDILGETTRGLSQKLRQVGVKTLQREQLARLKQIDLQVRGHRALTRPEVVKALELTPKQVKAIADID